MTADTIYIKCKNNIFSDMLWKYEEMHGNDIKDIGFSLVRRERMHLEGLIQGAYQAGVSLRFHFIMLYNFLYY